MKIFDSFRDDEEGTWAVFKIELENHREVFMEVVSNRTDNRRGIVVVNAESFLRLCRNNPYMNREHEAFYDLCWGDNETWKRDAKYHEFSCSSANDAIPLPLVACGNRSPRTGVMEDHYVSVQDGLARLRWLLRNDVSYFLVECPVSYGAAVLHKIAGHPGHDYYTVDELMREQQRTRPFDTLR